MKSVKIYYICMIMILIFASGCSVKNREESEKEMGSGQNNLEESTVNTEGLQVIDIHEKIMDNLLIEAKVNVYGKKYKSYQTSYKNFDVEKMTTLFMPDAKEDELQIDRSEDGSMITHQEETININPGILRYTPLYKFYKWNPCCTISCFKAFITAFDFMLFSILSTKVA